MNTETTRAAILALLDESNKRAENGDPRKSDALRVAVEALARIVGLPQGWDGNANADSIADNALDDILAILKAP